MKISERPHLVLQLAAAVRLLKQMPKRQHVGYNEILEEAERLERAIKEKEDEGEEE